MQKMFIGKPQTSFRAAEMNSVLQRSFLSRSTLRCSLICCWKSSLFTDVFPKNEKPPAGSSLPTVFKTTTLPSHLLLLLAVAYVGFPHGLKRSNFHQTFVQGMDQNRQQCIQ